MEGVSLPFSPTRHPKDSTCSFQQGFVHQRLQLLFQGRLGTLAGAGLLKHQKHQKHQWCAWWSSRSDLTLLKSEKTLEHPLTSSEIL